MRRKNYWILGLLTILNLAIVPNDAFGVDLPKAKILFLGDNGHHKPFDRYRQLAVALEKRNIEISYTDRTAVLASDQLAQYDGLIIYANTTKLEPAEEKGLMDYVASGKGFIPLHCASYCFLNSPKYIELVGAQFQRHGTGVFRVTQAEVDHPILKNFHSFESWDETYHHTKHNEKNRIVLEYHNEGTNNEGTNKEPWTWVRTHEKGRVFYTAWGHDERTWGNPGFVNLVERGIRWAIGQDVSVVPAFSDAPEMTKVAANVKALNYVPANVPFYPPNRGWGTLDDGPRKMQLPLPANESMKHIVHPADLELKLFADETLLKGKPICMNWDSRGRLWLAITEDYPNNKQPAGKGHDRIIICEDTDGDGKADKVTVFADHLSIPTSFTFARGGIIVHQAPETLFLKDTDGDDKADVKQVLFTGWHTSDTHAGPSNLNYGPDNWIYGMVGYSGFDGEIGGQRQSFRTGFYRFKPDATQFEFLRNTNNNSWGVSFTEDGLLFGSTANGCPSVYLPIPNRYYESVRGFASRVLENIAFDNKYHPVTDKIRQVDFHGGFTSAAGHAIYTARAYPSIYWNQTAFVSDPTGHLTATLLLEPNGSDFRSRYGWNLFAGDEEWVAPISAEVGPDGNMWVIDWYAYIVQHNPTPRGFKTGKGNAYESELRDKKHGRIYRLVAKGAEKIPAIDLTKASGPELVEALKNSNLFWRRHAQRLLVERGQKDVVPNLLKLISDRSVDSIGLNPAAFHALWTLDGLGAIDSKDEGMMAQLKVAMTHPSSAVQRAAIMVFPKTEAFLQAVADLPMTSEVRSPQVRLAFLLALAEVPPSAQAGQKIAMMLADRDNLVDRWIPDALIIAAAHHDRYFLQEVAVLKKPLPEEANRIISMVSEHYARRGPTDSIAQLLPTITKADPKVGRLILAALVKGWPKNTVAKLTENDEKLLGEWLKKLPASSQSNLVQFAQKIGSKNFAQFSEKIVQNLILSLHNDKLNDEERLFAAIQLIDFRNQDNEIAKSVIELITPKISDTLATQLLEAVGRSQAPETPAMMLKSFPTWTPKLRQMAMPLLLAQPAAVELVLKAIQNRQIQLSELSLDQKQALSSHPNQKIAQLAKKLFSQSGGLPDPNRQKVIDDLSYITKKTGNASLGKEMFVKHCATCHIHGSLGNKIGPELTGMAVHPKEELLIHILDPNRSVEGNFRIYKVELADGRILQGLLASETKTSIELVDAQAKKQTILREDIEKLTATTQSLMPEGFEKQMTGEEFTNLLEFLTKLGKFTPLLLDKVANSISTKGMFFSSQDTTERLIFPDWKPKTFKGIPFILIDPEGDKKSNALMLYGSNGNSPPKMPRSVSLDCSGTFKAIHFLSGVAGWGFPFGEKGGHVLTVRLHYKDGKTEDHLLKNGEHFADYIRRVDVPNSEFAFALRGQQIRYLSVSPKREVPITKIDLIKGSLNETCPIIMAITLEGKE